jgi:hypothetical protein
MVVKKPIDISDVSCYHSRSIEESAESPECPGTERVSILPLQVTQRPADNPPGSGMEIDSYKLHRFWWHTANKLSALDRRVREGKDLDYAREFAVFVLNSGMVDIFEAHACAEPFKVDGAFIRWKTKELQTMVQDIWATKKTPPVQSCTLDAINHKLDLIAGQVAKLSPPKNETTDADNCFLPALHVIRGGVQ